MARKISEEQFDALVAENRFVTDVQLVIERAMDERGISQADLARVLDVSEARISQILSDNGKNMQARTIARIAHALALIPSIQMVEKAAYLEKRKTLKQVDRGGPFKDWLRSLEHCPTATWQFGCNDNDQYGLEAA
jgi:transcriptional regulator with XRE-family HTH domain